MKIAVLSDLHGNAAALSACVAYALKEQADMFIFLGDYLGELAYPPKTMALLYELRDQYCCYFVRGNKEDYWLNHRYEDSSAWKEYDSTTGALFYTYGLLTKKDLEFFEGLSYQDVITIKGFPAMTICHGSPERVNDKMLPGNEQTLGMIERACSPMILCGHTHIQGKIVHEGKVVLNPGSVGVALHSRGKAQFMLLHSKGGAAGDLSWEEAFISLAYDVDSAIADLHESGLYRHAPCWCKVTEHLLRTGEVSHGEVLAKAMALCREGDGVCNYPAIPEKYWEEAAAEMTGSSMASTKCASTFFCCSSK